VFSLKLIPFLPSKKPCLIKQGLKEGTTVLRRQIFKDSQKKTFGRVSVILKKTANSGDARKNLLI
jgi:hypothetical protein